ncbi:MAG: rhomboid family intramembrane serine protease, partial [Planctomycetes bacterium]|nr:rhomboid family intramembrane serine protease [Planctomycetota bacterium]
MARENASIGHIRWSFDSPDCLCLDSNGRCFGQYSHVQLISRALLHGGILHLAGNMLFLLIFCSRVNSVIGNI